MAKYYYDRHEINVDTWYRWIGEGNQFSQQTIAGWRVWYISNGLFTLQGDFEEYPTTGGVRRVLHSNSTGGTILIQRTYDPANPGYVIRRDAKLTFTNAKGDFIETVTAEDGTYPDNGVSGSYWYIKKV